MASALCADGIAANHEYDNSRTAQRAENRDEYRIVGSLLLSKVGGALRTAASCPDWPKPARSFTIAQIVRDSAAGMVGDPGAVKGGIK
jgi:hypothetical protein